MLYFVAVDVDPDLKAYDNFSKWQSVFYSSHSGIEISQKCW